VGKETDRKSQEGDVLAFKTTEYGRLKMVVASEEVNKAILESTNALAKADLAVRTSLENWFAISL
jgi:hypothetical protein